MIPASETCIIIEPEVRGAQAWAERHGIISTWIAVRILSCAPHSFSQKDRQDSTCGEGSTIIALSRRNGHSLTRRGRPLES